MIRVSLRHCLIRSHSIDLGEKIVTCFFVFVDLLISISSVVYV